MEASKLLKCHSMSLSKTVLIAPLGLWKCSQEMGGDKEQDTLGSPPKKDLKSVNCLFKFIFY